MYWIKATDQHFFLLFLDSRNILEFLLVGISPAGTCSLPTAIVTHKPAVTHNTIQIRLQIQHKYCCKYNTNTVVILTRGAAVTRIHDENFAERWAGCWKDLSTKQLVADFFNQAKNIRATFLVLKCWFYASCMIFSLTKNALWHSVRMSLGICLGVSPK